MRKPGEPLRYQHEHTDHFDGHKIKVGGYVDRDTTLVQVGESCGYVNASEVPSMVVALFANTDFIDKEPSTPTEKGLQELATQFIDVFREAMVPRFREAFAQALNEASDDWDAKCRVSDIIRRYEGLR